MSSKSVELLGVQEPRVRLEPKRKWSEADDAAFLASSYGLTPDVWQHMILEAWLGRRSDGKYAAGRCGLAVPRQNGKNGVIEIRELYGMVVLGEKFLHTAHEVKTARKAFLRLASFFENERKYPELAALVKEIRKTNGQEAIALTNGGAVEFVARSRGSGRGYTVDVLVMDEAQELSDEALEALLPTISAAPLKDPQTILTGTPPGPQSVGEVFTRTRDAGKLGKDSRLSWHEWSVEGQVDVTDPALWASTNPALGLRLNRSVIEDELGQMSEDGFARERLGRWASDSGTGTITPARWAELAVGAAPEGIRSYAVAFSFDDSRVAVAGARKPEAGAFHVELIDAVSSSRDAGVSQLVWWFCDDPESPERWRMAAQIALCGRSGATVLFQALRDAGVPERVLKLVTTDQYTTACAMTLDAVREGSLTHLAGQAPLDASVTSAEKKARGVLGAWGWAVPGGDETPVEAISVALWAAKTSKRKPGRKSVVSF